VKVADPLGAASPPLGVHHDRVDAPASGWTCIPVASGAAFLGILAAVTRAWTAPVVNLLTTTEWLCR